MPSTADPSPDTGSRRFPRVPRTPALVRALMRQTLRVTQRGLAERGFTDLHPMQVGVVHLIGNGRRVTDMAAAIGATKQALAQTVDVLVERGYAERHPDPSDGRAKVVTLTERGREAAAASLDIADQIDDAWESLLGIEEMDALRSRLSVLIGAARRADGGWGLPSGRGPSGQ